MSQELEFPPDGECNAYQQHVKRLARLAPHFVRPTAGRQNSYMRSRVPKEAAVPVAVKALETTLLTAVHDDVVTGCIDAAQVFTSPTDATVDPAAAVLHVGKESLRLPIQRGCEWDIYEHLATSPVAKRGVGDVVDKACRSSNEAFIRKEAGPRKVSLPPHLLRFRYPAALDEIRRRLCPEAEEIDVLPYKLVAYDGGDFFGPHVDTPQDAMHFGTLVVNVPIDDAGQSASEDPGGEIVLHCGREEGCGSDRPKAAKNDDHSSLSYERPASGSPEAMDRTVQLATLPPEAEAMSVPMTFAAWHTDVVHEVLETKAPLRIVITYKLFKRGRIFIPPTFAGFEDVERGVKAVFAAVRTSKETPESNEPIQGLGVLLRHMYPPAGLVPAALKGMDALLHAVCSRRRRCHLVPVVVFRFDYCSSPFRTSSAAFRFVACPTKAPLEMHQDPRRWSESDVAIAQDEPCLVRLAWAQLGLGSVLGGGVCYGNADVPSDWWYTAAALVVEDCPPPWQVLRWIFAAQHRSAEAAVREALGQVVVQRVTASFLCDM